MLKIKDNVELKELEKFGFSPLYNQYTGELEEMYYTFHYIGGKKIVAKKHLNKAKTFSFQKKDKKNKLEYRLFAFIDCGYANEYADIIYDLIKAGLVEKVGE